MFTMKLRDVNWAPPPRHGASSGADAGDGLQTWKCGW